MGRKAITLDEQISLLQSRGMIIDNIEKAKEVLLDVGYYRLGFYWFPFEKPCENNSERTHEMIEGSQFDNAVKLYYFDFKLRSILYYYLNRIEINLRNYITYTISNKFPDNPFWFVDSSIVSESFINTFDSAVYTSGFRQNKTIRNHHRKHRSDRYAPAWKTIELMTMGSVLNLYKSLKDERLKREISQHYGIRYVSVFENYMEAIRQIRNCCAHGNVLFDFVPFHYIRRGPAEISEPQDFRNLRGAISVVLYMLKQVSVNRYNDMIKEIKSLIIHYNEYPVVKQIIENSAGLRIENIK